MNCKTLLYRISTAGLQAAHASLLQRKKDIIVCFKGNKRENFGGEKILRIVWCKIPQIVISLVWQMETWLMFGRNRKSLQVSPRICSTYRAWSCYWEENINKLGWKKNTLLLSGSNMYHLGEGAPTCFCLKASINFDTPQKVMGKVRWGPL